MEKIKSLIKEFFTLEGKEVRDYQVDLIYQSYVSSIINNKICVLSASASGGKTLMSCAFMYVYLNLNPDKRVLVSTHNQTTLRTQFYKELMDLKTLSKFTSLDPNFGSIVVNIPMALVNQTLPTFDLLIADEAHEFYWLKNNKGQLGDGMVQDIIKRTKIKNQLLLTATPSCFVYEKKYGKRGLDIDIIGIGMLDLLPYMSKVSFQLVSVPSILGKDHYNQLTSELKDTRTVEDILQSSTIQYMDYVLEKLIIQMHSDNSTDPDRFNLENVQRKFIKGNKRKLKSFFDNQVAAAITNKSIESQIEKVPVVNSKTAKSLFDKIGKTMCTASSTTMATEQVKYFRSIGIEPVLSISNSDDECNKDISEFENSDSKVLIVVRKGILGWSCKELFNVIDMSMSFNPNRNYQLFARVCRQSDKDKNRTKLFIKVVPSHFEEYAKYYMTAVMWMTDWDFISEYSGKNFRKMKFPVNRSSGVTRKHKGGSSTSQIGSSIITGEMIDILPLLKMVKQRCNDVETYCYTTLEDVSKTVFENKADSNYWRNKERLKELFDKYTNLTDMKNDGHHGAIRASQVMGYYTELTSHFKSLIGKHEHQDLIDLANSYDCASEFRSEYNTKYTILSNRIKDGQIDPSLIRWKGKTKKPVRKSSAGYPGITRRKNTGRYCCLLNIYVPGAKKKRLYVGEFDTVKEAVDARNAMIRKNNLPKDLIIDLC